MYRTTFVCLLAAFSTPAAAQPPAESEPPPTEAPPPPEEMEPAREPATQETEPAPEAATTETNGEPHVQIAPEQESEPVPEPPSDGPIVEQPVRPGVDPLRGLQEDRFARAENSSFGGYGELHFNMVWPEGGGDRDNILDLHRLVLFFAHNFTDDWRFYTEVEVEHAFVAGGEDAPGEVGIEQAYLDWRVLGDDFGIRAGIVLVPMGIINQWHEPPIFNGVERPNVDRVVIPTTWREGGIGFFGEPIDGLRYELYVMGGLDARGFSAGSGIRGGRQHVAEAVTSSPAVSGRVEYEPALGVVTGMSFYFNMAGANVDLVPDAPVIGFAADARLRLRGIEARALASYFHIGDAAELRMLTDPETGENMGIDVGSDILGVYGEIGYDVLHPIDTEHALVPFVRVEFWDTTLGETDDAVDRPGMIDAVLGLCYRPIPQVTLKTDFVLRRPSEGDGENRFNLGVGWMF